MVAGREHAQWSAAGGELVVGHHQHVRAGHAATRVDVLVVVVRTHLAHHVDLLVAADAEAAAAEAGAAAGTARGVLAAVLAHGATVARTLLLLLQLAALLRLPVSAQRRQVHVDALQRQLLLLLLKRLHQFFLSPVALLALQLFGRDGLAAAGLRVRVVRRSAGTLLGVLLLAPLGSTVLEPHLQQGNVDYERIGLKM